ncbi:nuclear pore complex protein DDB_G0274915 [Phlebotomus argentipes]|uniref:nuclear pore complex protein DDB_G0274915 n=1 Tax=Phlebotomus argentipes TaxID=94469 RepID=UPI002892A22C|nr:nuclear pore complex protein DDB_G0274915 [Phlebotomus argentipes]XP_059613233.1 nuclear pore complex protein DDB_G0274915 [Phlebotomus argentipes]
MFGRKNDVKSTNSHNMSSSSWARNDSSRALSSGAGKSSSRIDPEILLDTQSNGLSSRIVKYYEENQRMSRSPRTIYNKPGQFPIVHLKKNAIVYSTKRNNPLSVVKIAPPDKSVSDRNLRLNILRQGLSSSSASSEEYLEPRKYDNEPLTPSGGIESTPTRSVLDALTEISRKRIHNEDFNGDRMKKPCKDFSEIDGPVPSQTKRQRERVSPPSADIQSPVESNKKKICRDSHDILSSLSSSVRLLNPKRRIDDVLSSDAKRTHYQKPQATVEPKKRSPVASVEPQRRPDLPSSQKTALLVVTPPKTPPKPTPKVTLFNQNYDKIQDRVLSDTDDDEESRSMNLVRPKQSSTLLVKDKEASKKGTKSKLAMMLSYLSRNFEDKSADVVDSKEEEKKKEESQPVVKPVEEKTPEIPKVIIPVATTSAPPVVTVPVVTVSKPTEEVKEKEKEKEVPVVPVVTSTPLFNFGVSPAKTDVETVKITATPEAPMIKEVVEAEKKPAETPAVPQFKPAVSLAFNTPVSFGSTVAPSVSPVTSVTTVVSSSPFSVPFGGNPPSLGNSVEPPKASTTFTMTSTAASAVKTPSFPAFAPQAPATPSSMASLFGFAYKPVVRPTAPVVKNPSLFTFGTPASQPATTAEAKFVFGSPTTTTVTSAEVQPKSTPSVIEFGKPNNNNSMFTFGGGNTPKTTSSGGFSAFSRPNPVTSVSAFETPKTQADTKSLFTFGSVTSTSTTASQGSPFVFSTPQAKPAATTTPSAPFSFEKKTTTPFDASTGSNSIFGGTQAAAPPAFGAFGGTPAPTTTTSTNAFGTGGSIFSSATVSSPFGGFGTSNNAAKPITTTTSAPVFAFAAENKTPAPVATPAAGIFGGQQTSTNAFGTTATTDKPFNFSGASPAPFQFGGATTTASSSPFSFSSSPNAPNTAATPSPFGGAPANNFAFGQDSPKPPPPAFGAFGGGGNAPPPPAFGTSNSSPAFNFTASNPSQQQPFAFGATNNPQGGAPMFSIGSNGGTMAQRRPYRHATRRLK